MNLFQQMMVKPWVADQGPVREPIDDRMFFQPTAKIGLRLFLVVVTVFFSLVLSTYIERKVFADWNSLSLPWLLWANTGVLVLCSIAMHYALVNARRGHLSGLKVGFWIGGVLTFVFIAGQLLAWQELVSSGHVVSLDPANAFFYMLTGLHGIHLLGGLVAWARTLVKIRRGDTVGQVRASIDLCALYWHFLLLLWLVLFALLLLT